MYEVGGFIVHFFSREKVEQLARGYEVVRLEEFEEGGLPRKLFVVTLRKPVASPVRGYDSGSTGGRGMDKKRYAHGEIDREEYEPKKRGLLV